MTYQDKSALEVHKDAQSAEASTTATEAATKKEEPTETSTSTMKPLNDELTFTDRDSHLATAANDQSKSVLRSDAAKTTDVLAFGEMFDYIKSDSETLDVHKDSEIAKFYAGRSIFITGASGFVGKCLLEKLLRSCPDLKRVYILMRPKRGHEVEQRVENLIKSELFDRLRNSTYGSEQFEKIYAIKGDITKPKFDLKQSDIDLMSESVSLVFHSAATVKFVEPLRVAVENNVVSVDNLVDLASRLKNLQALVHVSTAYSNCDRKQVDEVFYETPVAAQKLIDMTRWMKPETFEEIAPILLGKRPNTYTYTKAVAESLLMERSKQLLPNVPIAMVRPSIVAGIWRQPICGWVDNFNGPTGVILSMMTGAIQAMLACPNYCADIVPVDIVANLIICTAWQVHTRHHQRTTSVEFKASDKLKSSQRQEEGEAANNATDLANEKMMNNISIFNCVSGTLNPVAWSDFAKYIKQIGLIYPCNNVMRWPGTLLLSNELIFNVFNFLNHTVVAYTGDFCLKIMGKKPTLVIVYNRLMKMIATLKPFTTNQWLFKCTNVTCLYEHLTPVDKEIFNFDIRQVRWDDYLRRYYVGSKIFALKDDPNDVVKARHKLRRIQFGSRLTQFLLLLLTYYLVVSGTQVEQYGMELFENMFSKYSMTTRATTASNGLVIDKQDCVGIHAMWQTAQT